MMLRNPTMLYYNVMMPPGAPFAYPPVQKAPKRRKKKPPLQLLQSMHPYKRKRVSLAYYLKYVLWRKIRRYWKKRKSKKKKAVARPTTTAPRGNGSEKIGTRDFWGSKYGSQWLFAKEDAINNNDNRIVEIVDAFKTQDLKYNAQRRRRRKCGCCRDGGGSEWSLTTPTRPYSKWPPPTGVREERLVARQRAYVCNWLCVDQRPPWVDGVRARLAQLQEQQRLLAAQLQDQGGRRRRRGRSRADASSDGGSCGGGSEWGSTLSRRERAKLLKRQVRAKERASVLWLLSKAFDGDIPPEVLEPFYRDKDNVRRLKPKIVHSLANAELYCLALTNIYSDPNYNNLDHHGIVQFLTRKGIPLLESRELPLTETTLVQTAPFRMNAHMAVIGGIMSLYIKEVLIPEKVVEVVGKFSHVDPHTETPSNAEEAAMLWINKCCRALENDIRSECPQEHESRLPKIPVLKDISDVSDGCCIAAIISYYHPNFFRWQDICWNNPISLGDSIHNLQLVKKFCSEFLSGEVNFFTMEDLLYLHPSMKDNVLAFIADLLFMFVIRAACVTPRKSVHHDSSHIPLESSKSLSNFQSHKTPAICSPIPNLRSDSYGGSTSSLPDITRPGTRARNCGSKERLCEKVLTKKSNYSDEVGLNELQRTNSVGLVNGWKTNLPHVGSTDSVSSSRHPDLTRLPAEGESASSQSQPSIYSADDSGLPKSIGHGSRTTLCSQSSPPRENFGFGIRKSSDVTLGYRPSVDSHVELRKSRKSLEDYYSQLAGADGPMRSISASNITDGHRKKDYGESVPGSASSQSSGICLSDVDIKNPFSTTSFAQLSKSREPPQGNSFHIAYMQEREMLERERLSSNTSVKQVKGKKSTTFAALPNMTTWQQIHSSVTQTDSGHETPTEPAAADHHLNAQLCNIKMKLEDKRRKIELKKKQMEMLWKKQRQKLCKAAFLQAVSKGSASEAGTPDSGTGEAEIILKAAPPAVSSPSMVKRMSMQDIAADLDSVQKKWLHHNDATEQISVPEATIDQNNPEFSVDVDGETMNLDLVTSIEHLNTSLTDLQADISRISLQQEQVENLMKDSIDDGSHFFLHGPSMSDHTFEALAQSPQICYYESPERRLRPGGFSSSPDRPKGIYHQAMDHSTPYTSLPPAPNQINKEDLYSKVIKPDRGQKQAGGRLASSPPNNRQVDSLAIISNLDQQKKPLRPKPTAEIHVVLPQVPDHKLSDLNSKKPNEETQGFYIPIEKGVRKAKPKAQRGVAKAASSVDVPNSLSVKNVPRSSQAEDVNSLGFVIGADLVHPDPETETEMARKKEMIMNLSIQRKAEYERKRIQKEQEYARIKDEERRKQEYQEHKREEEKRRRESILEQYRQRKLAEELEKEKSAMPKELIGKFTKPRSSITQVQRKENRLSSAFTKPTVELRNNKNSSRQQRRDLKPRPKSAYVPMNSDLSSLLSMDSTANKRNSQIFPGRDMQEFDLDSLNSASTAASSHDRHKSPNGFFPSHRNSLQIPEGSGPSSDGASDTASNGSAAADYTGPKLFVKPAAKSNRGIIINAINTVLAGAVNADTKKKVLEEMNRSESKHFLILFRDAGCQFRALYTYNPDREEVTKLFGIGPKNVVDKMMERFYKYNSGGKCFSEIQTKHLTVTIDAFTIPNSLWAGKKVIPPKKEFF